MGLIQSRQKVKNVVKNVDLNKYKGLWYEIAKIPTNFEPVESYNVTATYTPNPDGSINVLNESYIGSEKKSISGSAVSTNKDNSQLIVTFNIFSWFKVHGDYWIIRMDSNYQWVIVSEPYGDHLWILSRDKTMSEEQYQSLIISIKDEIDITRIVKTIQN